MWQKKAHTEITSFVYKVGSQKFQIQIIYAFINQSAMLYKTSFQH